MMKSSSHFNPIHPQASQLGCCLLLLVLASLFCWNVKPIGAESLRFSSHPIFSQPEALISKSESLRANVISIVRQDLSRRTKLAANQLKLVEAKQKTWQDGCLGLAKPDEMCTQALIDGWRVVFSHNHHTWIYRTDSTGRVFRLEN